MAKLNITQAAQAVEKHRSTLQRHIKDGVLSAERDAAGNPVVDVSELQRVYGTVKVATGTTVTQNDSMQQFEAPLSDAVRQSEAPPSDAVRQLEALQNDPETAVLRVKLEAAERERDDALERERWLRSIVEKQSTFIAALPAPAAKPSDEQTSTSPKRGFWARVFGR